MIRISVVRKKNGSPVSLVCKGHADYSEEGSDIYCSAVSALVINAVNSIEKFTDDAFDEEDSEGYLKVEFPENVSGETRLLFESLLLGLNQIEMTCNGKYLSLTIREV